MQKQGTKILRDVTPVSIAKQADGQLLVTLSNGASEYFDTVVAAIGRTAGKKGHVCG